MSILSHPRSPPNAKSACSPSTGAHSSFSFARGDGAIEAAKTGWFKEVHVKDIDSHSIRALLASRALLVKIKRDLENHIRKNLGLVIGRAKFNLFAGEPRS